MKRKFLTILLTLILGSLSVLGQTPFSKELEKKAKGGDVEAMLCLSEAYFSGNGVDKNANQAEKWLKKAADKKSPEAFNRLVDAYQSWDLIEKNPDKAFKWAQKGAYEKFPELQLRYAGLLYDRGLYEAAYKYANKAFLQGNIKALAPLALYSVKSERPYDAYNIYQLTSNLDNIDKKVIEVAAAISIGQMHRSDLPTFEKLAKVNNNDAIYELGMGCSMTLDELEVYLSRLDIDSPQYAMMKAYIMLFDKSYDNKREEVVNLIKKAAEGGIPDAITLMAIITSPEDELKIVKEGKGYDSRFNALGTLVKRELNFPSSDNGIWMRKAEVNRTAEGALTSYYNKVKYFYDSGYDNNIPGMWDYEAIGMAKIILPYHYKSERIQNQIHQILNHNLIENHNSERRNNLSNMVKEADSNTPYINYSDNTLIYNYYNTLSSIINNDKIDSKLFLDSAEHIYDFYPINFETIKYDIVGSSWISENVFDNKIDYYVSLYPDLFAELIIKDDDKLFKDEYMQALIQRLLPKVNSENQEALKKYAYRHYQILL